MKNFNDADTVRMAIYGLIGSFLAGPPREDLLEKAMLMADFATGKSVLEKAWRRLGDACRKYTLKDIESEYHRLFVGLGKSKIMPYGSCYLSGNLMGQSLADLRTDLIRIGIRRKEGVKESEDHASALCETMTLLCRKKDISGVGIQQRFFSSHIDPWMHRFFKDLQDAPSAKFFRVLGQLGETFIDFEQKYFEWVDACLDSREEVFGTTV